MGRAQRARLVVVVVAGILAACGLELAGQIPSVDPTADGSIDGADGPLVEGSSGDADTDAPKDAGVDTIELCNKTCDGGCDASTCVLTCEAGGSCKEGARCPLGLPCEVNCTGNDSCEAGVDCTQATNCKILCSGDRACGGAVLCEGQACSVNCPADETCGRVDCRAKDCDITCGVGGGTGEFACDGGVSCRSSHTCHVKCLADFTCNGPIVARATDEVQVTCNDDDSCNGTITVSGGDAGVFCRKDRTCQKQIYCDAGRCEAACSSSSISVCCNTPNCVLLPTTSGGNVCTITDGGC